MSIEDEFKLNIFIDEEVATIIDSIIETSNKFAEKPIDESYQVLFESFRKLVTTWKSAMMINQANKEQIEYFSHGLMVEKYYLKKSESETSQGSANQGLSYQDHESLIKVVGDMEVAMEEQIFNSLDLDDEAAEEIRVVYENYRKQKIESKYINLWDGYEIVYKNLEKIIYLYSPFTDEEYESIATDQTSIILMTLGQSAEQVKQIRQTSNCSRELINELDKMRDIVANEKLLNVAKNNEGKTSEEVNCALREYGLNAEDSELLRKYVEICNNIASDEPKK